MRTPSGFNMFDLSLEGAGLPLAIIDFTGTAPKLERWLT
jgi:hypothetical protein